MEMREEMYKLFKLISVYFNRKLINYLVFISLIIYNFLIFINFSSNAFMKKQNIYDLLIATFDNYFGQAYFFFILFFVFIYSIGSQKYYFQYIFLKFKNRKQWFNVNILLVVFSSVFFTLVIFLQCLLEGMLNFKFNNSWSEYSLFLSSTATTVYENNVINYVVHAMTPLAFVVITMIFTICFFSVIGMLYYVLTLCFKKKIWAFLGVFLINCINIYLYNYSNNFAQKFSFYGNILILKTYNNPIDASIFYNRIFYWILWIFFIYVVGMILKSKKDLHFGDSV